MPAKIIVSYDGTANEDDAIALGRILGQAGAEVALAYVAHTNDSAGDTQTVLARGLELLGNPSATGHVVTDPSTPRGLAALAEAEGADVVVFCSDSHTAKGSVTVGNSAQRLLNGGSVAVAISPAGYSQSGDLQLTRGIAVAGDSGAQATAEALARAFGAELVAAERDAGLVVVGSRPEAEEGRVSLSAASENLIENAGCPVLVVPRGKALAFDGHVVAAA